MACSARRSSVPPGTGSATAASTSASASRASSVSAAASRSPARRFAASGWATSSWPPRSPTSGTSRASRRAWATCWTWRPKDLEKVIYFAAYMITSVDVEARHRDLPSIEARIGVERQQLTTRWRPTWPSASEKLEADLAELEAEGAKADVKRKVREGAERELSAIRRSGEKKVDNLDRVFDRFRTLKVQDLEGDELLYREMRDRFGMYFSGGMGAAAIQARLASFDLEAEAEILREIVRTGKGQRKTRALKRLKVVTAFMTTTNDPRGMVLDCVPVIPPDLRPMVQLDGGRFATSRPQRPVPARDQPQQPAQAPARPGRAGDHRQQREADAPGGRGLAVRQRPPWPSGHRSGQPAAEVAVGHAQGQAGPVPPEPARQARGLLRPFGHRGRPAAASCTSAACPRGWRWSCSSRS